jgi:catechol 2,3-dioxygenase-like lactoylglutathione lyase family enzyme
MVVRRVLEDGRALYLAADAMRENATKTPFARLIMVRGESTTVRSESRVALGPILLLYTMLPCIEYMQEGHTMDLRLELVAIPVSDVDRAKAFYTEKAGFHADHDFQVSEGLRFVQLTPPGSACSIAIGDGITDAAPGSVQGMQVVTKDVRTARAELAERGVEVSDVQEFPWGAFVFFSDPDGNRWAVQEIPPRA